MEIDHSEAFDTQAPESQQRLPMMGLSGLVLLPHMLVGIRVTDRRSKAAVQAAMEAGERIFVVPQPPEPDDSDDQDDEDELPQASSQEAADRLDDEARDLGLGVIASIEQLVPLDGGDYQVALHGQVRARLVDVTEGDGYLKVDVIPLPESDEPLDETDPLASRVERVRALIESMIELMPGIPKGVNEFLRGIKAPGHLADQTGYFPEYTYEERLGLLRCIDIDKRLELVATYLKKYLAKLRLRAELMDEVKSEIGENQREAFLREQLRLIREQLGEDESEDAWVARMRERLASAPLPKAARERAERELVRLERINPHSPEVDVVRTYVEWLLELAWEPGDESEVELDEAKAMLDADHYGLPKVKERIIEFLAVRRLAGDNLKSPILCFAGPPGVGKTSLGRSIARVLGRKFVRLSLGGVHDEAEIRGHRRTYIGALPGRILQGMREAKVTNPVFMLDEVDKIGRDFRGDPTSALLEVLDPEQNDAFSDHYLEVPYDLSKVVFITTANQIEPIPEALRDRMEVIHIPGYTEEEKLEIAKRFLVAKQLEANGITKEQANVSDEALRALIANYTREAGVRNLEREVAAVCRKLARRLVDGEEPPFVVRPEDLASMLGPARFDHTEAQAEDEVGVATGVAVTGSGGDVLSIEVAAVAGSGKLVLTGSLGDVMKESAQAALTYARSRLADELPAVFFEEHDLHVHVPEGAVPKDGPSAGAAIATALISALTATPVAHTVAMTGEVTLRGRVLPVGGVKEKALAALRAGIKLLLLPAKNEKDLVELPEALKTGIEIVGVSHMDEVLDRALVRKRKSAARKTKKAG